MRHRAVTGKCAKKEEGRLITGHRLLSSGSKVRVLDGPPINQALRGHRERLIALVCCWRVPHRTATVRRRLIRLALAGYPQGGLVRRCPGFNPCRGSTRPL